MRLDDITEVWQRYKIHGDVRPVSSKRGMASFLFAETRCRSLAGSDELSSVVIGSLRRPDIGKSMDKFFSDVQKKDRKHTTESEDPAAPEKKALPKGVVLGKDGKP